MGHPRDPLQRETALGGTKGQVEVLPRPLALHWPLGNLEGETCGAGQFVGAQ